MKKVFRLTSMLLAMLACSATFVACGNGDDKDDTTNNAGNPETPKVPESISTADLIGQWTIPMQGNESTTYTFTQDKLTISYGQQVEYEGAYSLNGDEISYKTKRWEYDSQTGQQVEKEVTETVKLVLLYNKSVMVWNTKYQNEDKTTYEMERLMFKKGATINATANDIKGAWYWYEPGNEKFISAALTIEGNKFDLIITHWGQRYTGTFTYQGGYMTLNVENGYTSREEHTGYGVGPERLNPETLEVDGGWKTLDNEHWNWIWDEMPFIANGSEAYGLLAGRPVTFVKK